MTNISDLNKDEPTGGQEVNDPSQLLDVTPPTVTTNLSNESNLSSDTATPVSIAKVTEGKSVENPSVPVTAATTSNPVSVAEKDPSVPTPSKEPSFLDIFLTKIEPIEEQKANFKMIIYSDPGVGKTDLLGQIPNNLIIDSEQGTETIQYSERRATNVKRYPFKNFAGLEAIVEEFHKSPEQLAGYKNISVDTVSNLHKRGLAEVLRREHNKAPSLQSAYIAETEHHTENNEHMRQLIQSLVALDRNIFLTVHKRTIEPKGQDARTFPDFSEKLANTIAGMMDVVAYMYIANVEGKNTRVLKFHPSSGVVAKARGRGKDLPDNMLDPTWEKINDILKLEM